MLLLRCYLAIATLLHGISKLQHGIGGIENMVVAHGLPAFFAYGVLVGEIVAPLMLLVGYWVTPAALLIAVNMVVAIWLAHTGQIFSLSKSGGWQIELQAFFLVSALTVAMTARTSQRR
ncbi:DoxX family protein [Polaromonas jejuensis]|uniref:DoxX family protein n=1 Tax=Polaromonas jejuensis TaxID=457502 RepID=A0ABW0Q5L8_9BURK|nr:DoxX family protein [Polaromonas jejuensis]